MISGGGQPGERYEPLSSFLETVIGRIPTVIIHNQNTYIEAIAGQVWQKLRSENRCTSAFVAANKTSPVYEPFLGMSDIHVISCMRQLASKLGYTPEPAFEKVIRAHLTILKELRIPTSLSGLYYLCQFTDMEEFHGNVMKLPCGEMKARIIWADMGADGDGPGNQLDLFRAVIGNLAGEAEQSAWENGQRVAQVSCVRAIKNNATLALSVNDMYSDVLLTYLLEEIKGISPLPFILIIDGVHINDCVFEYLRSAGTGCYCGIVAENAVELTGGDADIFSRLAERMDCFVLFKHSTGKTASVLSEIMGRYESVKAERSQGMNRGFMRILPQGQHDDVRYSTENRCRVRPEEITGLRPGQAIVFDTYTDQVIHFNF